MPWQCSICGVFSAENRNQLLNHIGRCHRNDPNFHCLCGVDGCTRTFRKYYSWRKHLQQKHPELPTQDDGPIVNMDHDNFINQNGEQLIENMEDPTRSAALYILKLQEECSLPKSTVAGIVSNTKTILQETLAHVQTQVQGCLSNANIDDQNVPGLREIFKDNITTNPFHNLETEAQQFAYYKAHFGLKEPQRIVLGRREVFKRRKGIMQQTQVNDEAYYIPLLDSLQQLLNDEFILEEIKNPHVSIDGLMRDYCDGYQFKMHPLFSVKPTALQIMLYYDDLETCNPLGSRATIHKEHSTTRWVISIP
ncbi:uncharacterized protein LOC114543237 [Dendronephthya gigantea]|uniref:uncharacterized protein LOC114543237 n=1 Tax=Dendronephthya gigantea TaxID=151771 RepID=UPI00106B0B27|nr:uncharacterized protein LOC114543237 [Dendronephthya gigantea]